jgi:transcriptional regulator with XRE-family HTH domain
MQEKSVDVEATPTAPQAFGETVRDRRKALGWSQGELGRRLGDVATSWVSGVERGDITPSDERLAKLAMLLGDDLRGAQDPVLRDESLALACLWRARADLLFGMSRAERQEARRRLVRMSRDLQDEAALHPAAASHLQSGQLALLSDIATKARFGQQWILRLVLVELGGMKIDAPAALNLALDKRLSLLDTITEDLGLTDCFERVESAFKPTLPVNTADLRTIGGPLGAAHARLTDPSHRLLLLLGHDPFGWFGARYLAGRWLLPFVVGDEAGDNTADTSTMWSSELRASLGAAATTASGPIAGSSVLGPVLGPVLGAAAGNVRSITDPDVDPDPLHRVTRAEIWHQLADWFAGATKAPELPTATPRQQEAAYITANLCDGIGQDWTAHELNKIIALYRLYEDWAQDGNEYAAIPSAHQASGHLERVIRVIEVYRKQEEAASAGWGATPRVKKLKAIADQLRIAAKAIATLSGVG